MPGAVQDHLLALHTQLHELQDQQPRLQRQVAQLQERLEQTAKTSSQPPSSDSPCTKPARRPSSGKRGARKGHPGAGVTLLAPTDVHHVDPASCSGGSGELGSLTLDHTHQAIELPPITMERRHFLCHQARCVGCGALLKADIPSQHTTGSGLRLTALLSALGGMHCAERALRFGVLWRQGSHGTASDTGNRWVELCRRTELLPEFSLSAYLTDTLLSNLKRQGYSALGFSPFRKGAGGILGRFPQENPPSPPFAKRGGLSGTWKTE